MGTAIQVSVDHQGHADARTDREEDEVGDVAAQTVGSLRKRREVHVVLETDVGAQLFADSLDQARPAPARKVRGHRDVAVSGVEDAWAAERRVGHLRPLHAGFRRKPAGDRADLADQAFRAADLGTLVAPGNDRAGDVGDRGAHPFASDIDPDHPTGDRIQLVQQRARPAVAPRSADLADEAALEQSVERERQRRLRQSADPSDLCPGERPLSVDQVEHSTLIDRAQEARRADSDGRRAA